MSTPYFRNLTRSQYDAFLRFIVDGPAVVRGKTITALVSKGLLVEFSFSAVWGSRFGVPSNIEEEHRLWRRENYDAEGRRVHWRGRKEGVAPS